MPDKKHTLSSHDDKRETTLLACFNMVLQYNLIRLYDYRLDL